MVTGRWCAGRVYIPACAGEPRMVTGRWCAGRVYPRVCGGAAQRRVSKRGRKGLSPRVRGSRLLPIGAKMRIGSIPACAGEP